MSKYVTKFGSLDDYTKGGIEIIDDDLDLIPAAERADRMARALERVLAQV